MINRLNSHINVDQHAHVELIKYGKAQICLLDIEEQMSLGVHHCEMDHISFLDTCNVNLSIVFCVSDIMTCI